MIILKILHFVACFFFQPFGYKSGREHSCSIYHIIDFCVFTCEQINAGAVMLTDCVFWFIIVPFLTIKDYNLNFVSIIYDPID